jgi:hypothetical protein
LNSSNSCRKVPGRNFVPAFAGSLRYHGELRRAQIDCRMSMMYMGRDLLLPQASTISTRASGNAKPARACCKWYCKFYNSYPCKSRAGLKSRQVLGAGKCF